MSLPTSKTSQQRSIRSFFHPKTPKYSAPPQASAPPPTKPSPASTVAPLTTTTVTPSQQPARSVVAQPMAEGGGFFFSSPHPQVTIRPVAPDDLPALRRIHALLLAVGYGDSFYASTLDPARAALFSRVITWRDKVDGGGDGDEKVVGSIVCRIEPLQTGRARDGNAPAGNGSSGFVSPLASVLHEASAAAKSNKHNGRGEREEEDEDDGKEDETQALYIQSLCLLSPYRSLGLASAALDQVLATAARDPSLNVRSAYAHVWTENEDGLRWYDARGFCRAPRPVENYYLKLRPNSAWIVHRSITLPAIRGALAASAIPSRQLAEGAAAAASSASSSSTPGVIQPTPVHVPQSVTAAVVNLPPPKSVAVPPPPRGPPPGPTTRTPPLRKGSGQSYQNRRAETEWNDLPADMMMMGPNGGGGGGGGLKPPNDSGASSGQSSRSSSAVRKKRDRAYPAVAFGS